MSELNYNASKPSPVIGIIGGTGPDACIDIQQKLSNLMKERCGAIADQDHFRVFVDNNTSIINRDTQGPSKQHMLFKQLLESIRWLENCSVNIAAIACNSAHTCFSDLQRETSITLVSIIDSTVDKLRNHGIKDIALLCTPSSYKNNLYSDAFSKLGIETHIANKKQQLSLARVIYAIKAGCFYTTNPEKINTIYSYVGTLLNEKYNSTLEALIPPHELFTEVIDAVTKKGLKHVVLGCTELPLLNKYYDRFKGINFYDPNLFLAEKIIEVACSYPK